MKLLKRRLKPDDLDQLREMTRLVNGHRFIALTIAQNTALIPEGKREKTKYEALVRLLENQKNQFAAGALSRAGLPQGQKATVDLVTGIITETE